MFHRRLIRKSFPKRSERLILFGLKLLTYPYRLGALIHRSVYFLRMKKSYQSKRLTLSVGNIVCGGSGKTPFVRLLAHALKDKGQVAILSRGFRSQAEHNKKPFIVSQGQGPIKSSIEGGDEPFLLAKHLPWAIVLAGKNRTLSAKKAEELGADLLILDDGMQHYALKSDVLIVLLSANDPFGLDEFLPRGRLRVSPKRLKEVGLIAVHHVNDKEQYKKIKKRIRDYSNAPVIGTELILKTSQNANKEVKPLLGRKLAAFCGIGNPIQFFEDLKKGGANLIFKHELPDHLGLGPKELDKLVERARDLGAEGLVCTEKDWVKLSFLDRADLFLSYASPDVKIKYDTHCFEDWINRVKIR
ncbi:MAG: tetraacyldisaccharide 4'-kinase [Simkaniaceae bacterium]